MNVLVGIQKENIGSEVNSVNARELHKVLGVGRDYSNWIKARIKKYGFVENEDYIMVKTKKEGNNATIKEYYITLDMAKELSMVENNEKGREARRYFIEVEKESREPKPYLIDGKDPRFVIGGYQTKCNQLSKKVELLNETVEKLIVENSTLALPAPAVDVEPYKQEMKRLNDELNEVSILKEHFEGQAFNLLMTVGELKKAPKIIKSMMGNFLDNPQVYNELGLVAERLERVA